jgi:hypothetical protein
MELTTLDQPWARDRGDSEMFERLTISRIIGGLNLLHMLTVTRT